MDLVEFSGGEIKAWEVKSNDRVGANALEMYKRYAGLVEAKSFELMDPENFLDILVKPVSAQ